MACGLPGKDAAQLLAHLPILRRDLKDNLLPALHLGSHMFADNEVAHL